MAQRSTKRRDEAHVRLYRHELECPAYRSLSTDARALLVEFRALFSGRENRLFMSVREAARRIGVSQRPAQRALGELLDRGFIRCVEQGGFSCKTKHATVYALECQPDNPLAEGATAPKTFMRWKPAEEITVAEMTTDGSRFDYRGPKKALKNAPTVAESTTENGTFRPVTVAEMTTQISYQGGVNATERTSSALGVEIRRPGDPFWLLKASWSTRSAARPVLCTGVWP